MPRKTILDLKSFLSEIKSTSKVFILVLGYGSSLQISDSSNLETRAHEVCDYLNESIGKDRWNIIYGGDPFNPEVRDVSHAVRYMKMYSGCKCFAVCLKEEEEIDGKLRVNDGPKGVEESENLKLSKENDEEREDFVDVELIQKIEKDDKGKVLWGGWNNTVGLVGATKYYLSEKMIKYLGGMVAFGGGSIAKEEIAFALHHELPLLFVHVKPKLDGSKKVITYEGSDEENATYNELDDTFMFLKNALTCECKRLNDDVLKNCIKRESRWLKFDVKVSKCLFYLKPKMPDNTGDEFDL